MTAPLIVDTVPTDGQTDFNIQNSIQFEFDVRIDTDSANSGTVVVYDMSTMDTISGTISLSSNHKIVLFRPLKALIPNHSFQASVIGADLNTAGGNIQSEDGDDLAVTYSVTFRTAEEQYVSLDEVSTMEDVEIIGPIRAETVETEELVSRELEISGTSPAAFTSRVSPSISGISITFPTGLDASYLDQEAVTVEASPVTGMEDFYATIDVNKEDDTSTAVDDRLTLRTCYSGDPSLLYTQPTGVVSLSAPNVLTWTKQEDQNFLYNSEVVVTLDSSKIIGTDGSELPADITFVFTTEYFPLFIPAKMLRIKMAPAIIDLYDDTLNQIIHSNSLDAWEQAGYKFSIHNPYPAVRRYVMFKSVIDVFDVLEAKDHLRREETKRLGDLEIRYGSGKGRAPAVYTKAEKEMEKALFELRAYRGQGVPTVVVPGWRSGEYRGDLFMRTWDNISTANSNMFSADLFGLPAANTSTHRADIHDLAFDHQGGLTYTTRLILTTDGLFQCID